MVDMNSDTCGLDVCYSRIENWATGARPQGMRDSLPDSPAEEHLEHRPAEGVEVLKTELSFPVARAIRAACR